MGYLDWFFRFLECESNPTQSSLLSSSSSSFSTTSEIQPHKKYYVRGCIIDVIFVLIAFIVSPLELTSSNFIAGNLFKMVTDRPIGAQQTPVFIKFRHRYSNFISDHFLTIQWQYYVHPYAYVHVNSSLLVCVFIIITIVVVTIIFHGGVGWGMWSVHDSVYCTPITCQVNFFRINLLIMHP